MARKAAKEKEGMGARVEALRNEKGWTQEELAQKLFMKREALKNKELGIRPFSLEEACALCGIFHITLDELVNGVRTENVSINEATGLDDDVISLLREYRWREADKMEGLNMALRSPDVLTALSRYMTYTPEEKGYYLSETGTSQQDRFIECRMSPEFYADVLRQNMLHMIDNAKAGNYSHRIFEAYEDFPFAHETGAKLAESSNDYGGDGNGEKK